MAKKPTVAVIGGGISGMVTARILQDHMEVTLFEALPRLGGHADTREVQLSTGGTVAVDIGFVWYNDLTYKNLIRLFDELKIESVPAAVTADVVCKNCGYQAVIDETLLNEGNHRKPENLSLQDWQRYLDETKRIVPQLAEAGERGDVRLTIKEFLDGYGYSRFFLHHYIYPRFSTHLLTYPPKVGDIPVQLLFEALVAHNLAGDTKGSTWRAIKGGTKSYIDALAAGLEKVKVSTPIASVRRGKGGVRVQEEFTGQVHKFDKVVLAVHAPTALQILTDPTDMERKLLGAIKYASSRMQLHKDTSVFSAPDTHHACRFITHCSMVSPRGEYHIDGTALAQLPTEERFVFSSNSDLDPSTVLAEVEYRHIIWNTESYEAQRRLPEISNQLTAFAGAYHHGFGWHEDGYLSAINAAKSLGVPLPDAQVDRSAMEHSGHPTQTPPSLKEKNQ
ncbi:FAD-dependent oxidoreductase [Streptomyces lavendulocolor]|uniref:FAD-dependent oxidoreductase n=1 Tax=Streptomyces lavendulocolor TaxID=67316 RepID=UPI003411B6B2